MAILSFSLSLEGVHRIRDAIACLAKFSEIITLEADNSGVVLTALNSSKTASASVKFEKDIYPNPYTFLLSNRDKQRLRSAGEKLGCQFYNKALLSVFRARVNDARDRDTVIERCDVNIQDEADNTECRLVVKMICRHGVKKTYKLTYEAVEADHAIFDRESSHNRWAISAYVLKAFSEFFGPRTEHLDMFFESGKMLFTSYTEKISHGSEILKQPLQTSVTIDRTDFNDISIEEKIHIGVSVKDFRAIVNHADSLKADIVALYSKPAHPLQISYGERGMHCDFILMTIGRYRGGTVTPAPSVNRERPTIPRGPATLVNELQRRPAVVPNNMPPPSQPASRSFTKDLANRISARPELPPPQASIDHESLFLRDDDEDEQQWGESSYDNDEDSVRWDTTGETLNRPSISRERTLRASTRPVVDEADGGVAPTQRLSQVRGLFEE